MQEQIFLTYINTSECDSYTLTGTVNDAFVDIDVSKRFFHVPLNVTSEGFTNSIKLKVNYIYQENSFQAMPILLWQPHHGNNLRQKYRYHLYQHDDKNFFIKQSLPWLGSNTLIDSELKIKKKSSLELEPTLIINNTNKLSRTCVTMKNFTYIPDSWLVCYEFYPTKYKTTPGKNIGIRIEKNLKFSPICSKNKFNYVSIGQKIIGMDKILFFKKINSIWDYLNCFKICQSIVSAHYY